MQQEAPQSSQAAEQSAAHILMELNHNYKKIESADLRSKEVMVKKETELQQQEEQKQPMIGSLGGGLCYEPFSAALYGKATRSASSGKSGGTVYISRVIKPKPKVYIAPSEPANIVPIVQPTNIVADLAAFQAQQQPISNQAHGSISNGGSVAQKRVIRVR